MAGKTKGYFQSKQILYFVEEFSFRKGTFCALAPKTYCAYNSEDQTNKIGTKGIPHSLNLSLQAFLSKLYGQQAHTVKLTSLRLDNENRMSRITQIKKGLRQGLLLFKISICEQAYLSKVIFASSILLRMIV